MAGHHREPNDCVTFARIATEEYCPEALDAMGEANRKM